MSAEGAESSDSVNVSKKDMISMARGVTESLRAVRMLGAVTYMTFIFAVSSISDALVEAGQRYNSYAKGKKTANPPCSEKWCALIFSAAEAATTFAKEQKPEGEKQKHTRGWHSHTHCAPRQHK